MHEHGYSYRSKVHTRARIAVPSDICPQWRRQDFRLGGRTLPSPLRSS